MTEPMKTVATRFSAVFIVLFLVSLPAISYIGFDFIPFYHGPDTGYEGDVGQLFEDYQEYFSEDGDKFVANAPYNTGWYHPDRYYVFIDETDEFSAGFYRGSYNPFGNIVVTTSVSVGYSEVEDWLESEYGEVE